MRVDLRARNAGDSPTSSVLFYRAERTQRRLRLRRLSAFFAESNDSGTNKIDPRFSVVTMLYFPFPFHLFGPASRFQRTAG